MPRSKAPNFEIAPVLEALGFENVPHVRSTSRSERVLCIFHGDTTPSARVTRYGFRCFACGRSGDAIKLLREEEGLTYADAVARAAAITGVTDSGSGGEPEPGWASLLD